MQVGHHSNNGRYNYILQSWLALGPDSLTSEAKAPLIQSHGV